jgi:molybdate transport system substrate-binding protein
MSARLSSILAVVAGAFFACNVSGATLTVAAASDLSAVQASLAEAYRKNEPNTSIRWVTSASGVLTQQIESGAPYDVFLSANAQFVERLVQTGKIKPNTVKAYASGRLGALWKDGRQHDLKSLNDASIRTVALPNPKLAPYGVAAQQALEHEGVWAAVSKKLVYGENVRQTLQLFESGNADVVITSDSLLQGKNPVLLPTEWHQPIVQKGGVVSASSNQESGIAFLQFLTSPDGQAVFQKFGFGAP